MAQLNEWHALFLSVVLCAVYEVLLPYIVCNNKKKKAKVTMTDQS